MDAFFTVWHGLYDLIARALQALHTPLEQVFGDAAWGWAIIALTVVIRILLLPLAIKQTHSMRAMQRLAPEMKRIKEKYKTDRSLMKSDPEKYKRNKQKQQQETMALYQEQGVNPAASCLPLLLQAPIFIALFRILQTSEAATQAPRDVVGSLISQSDFYFFGALDTPVNAAGIWGWSLVLAMAATMFLSQRQMMARNATGDDAQTQQQKIMMYVMPVFLAFVAQGLPIAVLLYWVTTNAWQWGQQAVIIHEVEAHPEDVEDSDASGNGQVSGAPSEAARKRKRRAQAQQEAAKQEKTPKPDRSKGSSSNGERAKPGSAGKDRSKSSGKNYDHLPRRPDRGK